MTCLVFSVNRSFTCHCQCTFLWHSSLWHPLASSTLRRRNVLASDRDIGFKVLFVHGCTYVLVYVYIYIYVCSIATYKMPIQYDRRKIVPWISNTADAVESIFVRMYVYRREFSRRRILGCGEYYTVQFLSLSLSLQARVCERRACVTPLKRFVIQYICELCEYVLA